MAGHKSLLDGDFNLPASMEHECEHSISRMDIQNHKYNNNAPWGPLPWGIGRSLLLRCLLLNPLPPSQQPAAAHTHPCLPPHHEHLPDLEQRTR